MQWKPMGDGREVLEHPDGFLVIRPVDARSTPLECEVCQQLMMSADDLDSYTRFSCCYPCVLRWAQARSEQWALGWRPSTEEVALEVARRRLRRPTIHL